ncbi:MAG: RHS repeat-associated core domain-containing protein [Terracidiphilus sp.]
MSGNLTSEYIFFNGQRIAMRNMSTHVVSYYVLDHLGSTSKLVDAAGNIINDSDYTPYGGELPFTTGNPGQHYKFTGKERDAETGNDYFGARYYANNMGRWFSPDWSAKVEPVPYSKLDDPQSLNLYAYVLNNPLALADADGHSTDIYKPDLYSHGGPHIDRETKGGKLVGRYRPDGTPIEHKKKTPPSIPKADQGRFEEAAKKVRRRVENQQEYQDDVKNRPPVPAPPVPDGLKPDPAPAPPPFPLPQCPRCPNPNPMPSPDPAPGPTPFPGPSPEPLPLPLPEPVPIPIEPIPIFIANAH